MRKRKLHYKHIHFEVVACTYNVNKLRNFSLTYADELNRYRMA